MKRTNYLNERHLCHFRRSAIAVSAMLAGIASGCNDNLSTEADGQDELRIDVHRPALTRALDASFEAGDKIGIFVVNAGNELLPSGNYADNVPYTLDGLSGEWMTEDKVYYPVDESAVDIYAYYPYDPGILGPGTTVADLAVKIDQTLYEDYTCSDFSTAGRTGITRSREKVGLVFDHRQSQLVFALKAGNGFSLTDLAQTTLQIKNAICADSFDMSQCSSGVPEASTVRSDILPNGDWQKNGNILDNKKAIIVPQQLDTETYIEIKLGERVFTRRFTEPVTIGSGESMLISITMHNSEIEFEVTLNPWNYTGTVEGDAEEEDDDKQKKAFITEWELEAGEFELPLWYKTSVYYLTGGGEYSYNEVEVNFDFYVDWGDGSPTSRIISWDDPNKKHLYEDGGIYEISITGLCELFSPISRHELKKILQWGDVGMKYFNNSFSSSGLTYIAPGMPDTGSLAYTFDFCKELEEIPEDLFINCKSLELMIVPFYGCENLASLPEGLFKTCDQLEFIQSAFQHTGLSSIPEDLFSYCGSLEYCHNIFQRCENLEHIPDNLFLNNPNLKILDGAFMECKRLKTIPENLFSKCINLENIEYCFGLCESLTGIPQGLFDNNPHINNFIGAFSGCTSVTGPTPRTNGLELWQRSGQDGYPNEVKSQDCFWDCTGLENYDEIPPDWR